MKFLIVGHGPLGVGGKTALMIKAMMEAGEENYFTVHSGTNDFDGVNRQIDHKCSVLDEWSRFECKAVKMTESQKRKQPKGVRNRWGQVK